jgi:hypothetical protein
MRRQVIALIRSVLSYCQERCRGRWPELFKLGQLFARERLPCEQKPCSIVKLLAIASGGDIPDAYLRLAVHARRGTVAPVPLLRGVRGRRAQTMDAGHDAVVDLGQAGTRLFATRAKAAAERYARSRGSSGASIDDQPRCATSAHSGGPP